jgi:hypothetical protein
MKSVLGIIYFLSFIFLSVALWNGNTDFVMKDASIIIMVYLISIIHTYFYE